MSGFGGTQVERMIQRPESTAKIMPSTKVLNLRAQDVENTTFKIVEAPHPYRYLGLSPSAGGVLFVIFGSSANGSGVATANERIELHPGSWVPIAGRSVVGLFFSRNMGAGVLYSEDLSTSLRDTVDLILTEEVSPPPMRGGAWPVRASGILALAAPAVAAPTQAGGIGPVATEGILIPRGYNRMTVQFQDDSSNTRIQGVETADIEVWFFNWSGGAGLWCHNPADDFDAGGRGSADASHDTEVYELNHQFTRVYLRPVSGNTFWAAVGFTREE